MSKKNINVLHIVAGSLSGGAARGAYWLHEGLKENGVHSIILTDSVETFGDSSVISVTTGNWRKLAGLIRRQFDSVLLFFYKRKKRVIFSTGMFGFDFIKTEAYRKADIIHLHWVNDGFVNIKHLRKIKKPIVWTMRDMWPMTGGCHYSMGCEKYKSGCGGCPQLGSHFNYDLSALVFNRKSRFIPANLKPVGISHWLTHQAEQSRLFAEHKPVTILNNVDTEAFKPYSKAEARIMLDINTRKHVILVGSTNSNDFYKGFGKFLESLTSLDKNNYMICLFGKVDEEAMVRTGFDFKALGYLNDNISLRLAYCAADVFVAPSIMEAFGKTLAESMACGTPVVCFDATGPKSVVSHGEDGYKAPPFEARGLAEGVEWVLKSSDYERLSMNARKNAVDKFSSRVIAEEYIDLYRKMLDEGKAPGVVARATSVSPASFSK